MSARSQSLFDAFNARFLEPEKVGSSFVSSPFLHKIGGPSHTAILGPRGSGKTTLLKMLTLPALLRWSGPQRDEFVRNINFLAIYIPASLTWSADYRSFTDKRLPKRVSELISVSLFRHGVLVALLDAWRDASTPEVSADPILKQFSLSFEPIREASLIRELAGGWGLEPAISSFEGVYDAIRLRIRLLQRLAVIASEGEVLPQTLIGQHPFVADNFLDDISAYWGFLERNFGANFKLALCFDEIEIASTIVAKTIMQSPRSLDQRFLIKYSAAPFVGAASNIDPASMPTEKNDFELVFLSSFSNIDTRPFSEALFGSLCAKYGVTATPDEVLGPSLHSSLFVEIGVARERQSRQYRASGNHQKRFAALARKDKSFREYTDAKGINLSDLSVGSENQRAAAIRKILWPVLVREEFLFEAEGSSGRGARRRLRSKDSISDIYTGAASLFALCEGNPRWVFGLLEPLIQIFASGENSPDLSVKRSDQKRAVERMISAYFALLSSIPNDKSTATIKSLVDIIDRIGTYFQNSVLGNSFNPDPALSFTVDDGVSAEIRDLVGKGINIGAFVTANETKSHGYRVGEISGLRVRLSNILAPNYKLPLTSGRNVTLSTIISRDRRDIIFSLSDLFGEKI